MKKFFGGIFIGKEKLEEAGIKHPIKLEYYKIEDENEDIDGKGNKYGIKVVKTQYIEDEVKVEDKTIEHLTYDEKKVDEILRIFKDNEVTPVAVQDILYDFSC